MNTKDQPELNLLEADMTNASSGVTHVELQGEDGDIINPLIANGMDDSEDTMPMTTEREEMEMDKESSKEEGEREHVPKEEGEEVSEDGTEEAFGEERPEEEEEDEDNEAEEEVMDEEGDEEGDTPIEPKDLSLVDYAHYENAALRDAHTAAAATYASGVVASYGQAAAKLSCDICGLSCVSINVLLVHKRSHTGERPFHCTLCGASFTQKGNLLRHIKLHSGEKPFKCPMCSYACRRRDALSGHLRTHSVEKPFKCNHCGRSYKQRSSLEEHRERCHVYIQSKGPAEREDGNTVSTQMGTERALLLDRLASNVAKRKSSMPQKFTGDNGVCLDLSFSREAMEPPLSSPGLDTHHQPHHHHQQQIILTGPDPDPAPSHPAYPIPLVLTNGHKLGLPHPGLAHSPQGHSGLDSLHGDGSQVAQPLVYGLGHLLGGPSPHNGLPHLNTQALPMPPLEVLRVVRGDGETGVLPGAMYPCGHCRVIFLDYVMFTIHMGCHGFRDPLECNMCGHRSRDRYEFSSHIARGEHRLELK